MKSCSRKILELFYKASHSGRIMKPEAIGRVGGDTDGLVIELTWRVLNDVIVDAKFRAFGNPNAIAITSVMTDYIINKTVDEAISIDESVIEQELEEIRPEYIEAFDMVKLAIVDAYNNYLKRIKRVENAEKRTIAKPVEIKEVDLDAEFESQDMPDDEFSEEDFGIGLFTAEQATTEINNALRTEAVVEEKRGRGRPRKIVEVGEVEKIGEKRGRGRPRKYPIEEVQEIGEKRGRGRPRKEVAEIEVEMGEKRGRGRPRKIVEVNEIEVITEKRGRGRPRKIVDESEVQEIGEKRGRGRPRKIVDSSEIQEVGEKRGRGRPRKIVEVSDEPTEKRGRGRPRKERLEIEVVGEKRGRGRPRKEVDPNAVVAEKKGRGRPRKLTIETLQPMAPILDDEPKVLPNDFDKADEVKSVDELITPVVETSYLDTLVANEEEEDIFDANYDIFKSNIRNILSGKEKTQSYISTPKVKEEVETSSMNTLNNEQLKTEVRRDETVAENVTSESKAEPVKIVVEPETETHEKRGRGRPRLDSVSSLTRSLSTSPKLNNSDIVFASKNVTTTNININVTKTTSVEGNDEYNKSVNIVNVEQNTNLSAPAKLLDKEAEISDFTSKEIDVEPVKPRVEIDEDQDFDDDFVEDTSNIKDEAPKGGIEDLLKALLQDD